MKSAYRLLIMVGIVLPMLFLMGRAQALTIEISQGVDSALPIAIVPFAWTVASKPPQDVASIVSNDLTRSGQFKVLPENQLLGRPSEGAEVDFTAWRGLGIENLLVGQLQSEGAGNYVVQFQLFDVYAGKQLIGYSFPAKRSQLRSIAHHISDLVYEKLTGDKGAFNTRIAYVTSQKAKDSNYKLMVADADGYGAKVILQSDQPLMSPSWSPDGQRLAYVSFENNRSSIWVQEVLTGKRRSVASFKGINGAPSWSPDGKKLALTLSRDGDPEIYLLSLASGAMKRVTDNPAIDTEPVWAPDGQSLLFTSDRSGRPQIYQVPAKGGRAERLTFDGSYNARARFSPDGQKITMVHGLKGKYRIAILDLESGLMNMLTDGSLDESPSFSPNGAMIIYATKYGSRDVLAAVSTDGNVRQRLVLQKGDVREPAWSPYEK